MPLQPCSHHLSMIHQTKFIVILVGCLMAFTSPNLLMTFKSFVPFSETALTFPLFLTKSELRSPIIKISFLVIGRLYAWEKSKGSYRKSLPCVNGCIRKLMNQCNTFYASFKKRVVKKTGKDIYMSLRNEVNRVMRNAEAEYWKDELCNNVKRSSDFLKIVKQN